MTEDKSKIPPIVEGEFEDHEWRAAAAKKSPDRNKGERRLLRTFPQPRQHPYSDAVVQTDEIEVQDPDTGESVRKRRFFADKDHRAAVTTAEKVAAEKAAAKAKPPPEERPQPSRGG